MTMTAEQVADLIRILLEVSGHEILVNSFDEIVVARGLDDAVLA